MLAKRFSPEELAGRFEALRRAGEPFGIVFGTVSVTPNTHLALTVAEYARDYGRHHSFHERVFVAHFTDGQDIGDIGVLLDLARAEGLDPDDVAKALQDHRYEDRLKAGRVQAERVGVTAVPTFVIDERFRVVGAQPIDSFRSLLADATRH